MTESLKELISLSVLIFVISSMASMGLSLKVSQILAPFKNVRLVVVALVANFILVPLLAYVITLVLPLDESTRIGLILLSTAAGAAFLPKLAQAAKGRTAFSVSLMGLLIVVTIVYLPIMLPLLLGGAQVNPWDIARSLIVLMLIPLAIGLFINARYEEIATSLRPTFGQASNLALLVLMALIFLGVGLDFKSVIGLLGSCGILAAVIFIVVSLVIGYLLGGSDTGIRSVMGLGTAQRNISAALLVAGQHFGVDVVIPVTVIGVIGLVILMPTAGELGKRTQKTEAATE